MIFVSDPMQGDFLRWPKGPTPNRYMPHQGKQEIARRLRQREALDSKVVHLPLGRVA